MDYTVEIEDRCTTYVGRWPRGASSGFVPPGQTSNGHRVWLKHRCWLDFWLSKEAVNMATPEMERLEERKGLRKLMLLVAVVL